jgi:hypothetical protein
MALSTRLDMRSHMNDWQNTALWLTVRIQLIVRIQLVPLTIVAIGATGRGSLHSSDRSGILMLFSAESATTPKASTLE